MFASHFRWPSGGLALRPITPPLRGARRCQTETEPVGAKTAAGTPLLSLNDAGRRRVSPGVVRVFPECRELSPSLADLKRRPPPCRVSTQTLSSTPTSTRHPISISRSGLTCSFSPRPSDSLRVRSRSASHGRPGRGAGRARLRCGIMSHPHNSALMASQRRPLFSLVGCVLAIKRAGRQRRRPER